MGNKLGRNVVEGVTLSNCQMIRLRYLILAFSLSSCESISGPPEVGEVAVYAPLGTMYVGDVIQFQVTVREAGTSKDIVNPKVEWATSNASVATVSTSGLVTAVGTGVAIISARSGGVDGSWGTEVIAWKEIKMGGNFVFGMTAAGDAYWWGSHLGVTRIRPGPAPLEFLYPLLDLSSGYEHACAIAGTRAAYCWGSDNAYRQLGHAGFGLNIYPQIPVSGNNEFSRIWAGVRHTCAINGEAIALCWGAGQKGRLGSGSVSSSSTPIEVSGGLRFTQLALGDEHTCALSVEGAVYCWGDNSYGQLGDGSQFTRLSPVGAAISATFVQIAARGNNSCGLTRAGVAYCWGSNVAGQIGNGTSGDVVATPVQVAGDVRFISLSLGTYHACGISTVGDVYCWGYGQAVRFDNENNVTSPRRLPTALRFVAIDANANATCGISSAGRAYCWGSNTGGLFGNGEYTGSTAIPVLVTSP